MAVDVGSAYGAITIDTSAIERAVAAAQSSLRGLDSINFGVGIGSGVAAAAAAVTGLQQTFAGLGTAGGAALRGLGAQLAKERGLNKPGDFRPVRSARPDRFCRFYLILIPKLTANTAQGLDLTSLASQIDAVQAKVQDGFLTIKENVTLAVAAFQWADYITPLTWPTVPALGWTAYISPLTWPTLPTFDWNRYVSPLTWPTIPTFGWADYVRSLTWSTIPTFGWVDYITPLTWPTVPAFGWAEYINPLTWPTLPLFAWNRYVSPLAWPSLPSFGWNDYINAFAWPTLPAFSWANLVPPFVWPSLPSFRWSDFISRFSWPSLPTIPGFAAGGVAPGGLARVAERGAEVLRVPGAQGLANGDARDGVALAGRDGDLQPRAEYGHAA